MHAKKINKQPASYFKKRPRPARKPRAAAAPETAAQHWLNVQCRMITGTVSGLIARAYPNSKKVGLEASWPERLPASKDLKAKILQSVIRDNALLEKIPNASAAGPNLVLYYPLPGGKTGDSALVLVLEMSYRTMGEYQTIKKLLKWNSEFLSFALPQTAHSGSGDPSTVLAMANTCLDQTAFRSTALAMVTQLEKRFACRRVSLGLRKRGQMDVQVLSDSARFKSKANLIQAIAAAMEEAADQDRVLAYPTNNAAGSVSHAHAQLADTVANTSVTTLPLSEKGAIIGAITLERAANAPLTESEIHQIEQFLELITPTLWLRHKEEQSLPVKIGSSLKTTLGNIVGPAHIKLKLASLATVFLLAFFAVAQGTWRVSADAVVEGRVQRTIAAPIDGYIASVDVRAGDVVKANQPMGSLDDGDLRLEMLKWSTLRQQMVSEAREAMAGHDRAQLSIVNAKIAQADAELQLIDEQLSRTKLTAPFDGIVIEGDLSQLLGTPVTRGEILFKVAPLNDYRIVLNVDEHDIGPVEVGQFGRLVLASMPGHPVMMRVNKVTPVSTAADGRNFFRVEASLIEPDLKLQPGMEGVGKISVGEENLLWIWTRDLANWLRLSSWTWWR